jgi:hypothetical protein
VAALQWTYVHLAPGTDVAVNVFDTGEDAEEAVTAVTELVNVLCGGRLNDVQRALVDGAARDAQRRGVTAGRRPLLEDCLPQLEARAEDVAAVVRRHCRGGLGALFNRPTSLRLQSGTSAVSLRDMPAEHVGAATLITARWIWWLIRHRRRQWHIVFDEVGSLVAHAPLRTLLVQLARRCRKYSASLVVATQNAHDLLATAEGSVVATNAAIALLGGHRPAEAAHMELAFGLTPAQRRFIESAGRGEFLLLAGDRRLEVRVEVPELHRQVLAPAPTGASAASGSATP